jgi:hypothetical protein
MQPRTRDHNVALRFLALFLIVAVQLCSYVKGNLEDAIFSADLQQIKLLLSKEIQDPLLVNRTDPIHDRTPLFTCGFDPQGENRSTTDKACAEITRLLHTQHYARLDAVDKHGYNAVSMAATRG